VDEKRRQRLQFLHELYRLTKGSESVIVDMRNVGATYNFDDDTTISITQYLEGEGLLKFVALGGIIGITHRGIVEVEEAITNEDKPTEHFPPARSVNIIQIHQMSNSQIQQNSSYSSQSYSLDAKNIQTLKDIIQELKKYPQIHPFYNTKIRKMI
jgi:hypothetical protein